MLKKIGEICGLLTVYPLACGLLWLDRSISANPVCDVPRSLEEIKQDPQCIWRLLCDGEGNEFKGATFLCLETSDGSLAEPDKNASVLRGVLKYSVGGETRSMDIFIKLPTTRQVAIWIKALGVVFASDHKEVAFYNRVLPFYENELKKSFPTKVPAPLYAKWNRLFDRAILISKCIDTDVFKPIPDHQGLNVRQINAQLKCAAKIHGTSWNLQRLPHLKEREGTAWLGPVVGLFRSKLSVNERNIWDGISVRTKGEPMVLSHGDCRAGNMLFKDTSDETEVIMTDWEANAITPYMWDCTYAIVCGLKVEVRRQFEVDIIKTYLTNLQVELKQNRIDGTLKRAGGSDQIDFPSLDSTLRLHRLMVVCIWYFGWILGEVGGVGRTQGNTSEDMGAWTERLNTACLDATSNVEEFANEIGVSKEAILFFRKKASDDLRKGGYQL